MRVLIVNTRHYRGGGDSNYAFNLADLLRSHGHTVHFFAMQSANNLPDPDADLFVSHIDYRALNQSKNPITAVQVLTRSIYSIEARQKFAALLERVQPDVIHLQNIHAHITPSVILEAKKRGLPVLWTLHDYKLVCPNSHFLIDPSQQICEACRGGRFWQAAKRRCKKGSPAASLMAALEAYAHRWLRVREKVDAFLCPSAFLCRKLLENGFPSEKTLHLPLFIPESLFEPTVADQGYLLFLGKLEPLKGIYPLLTAARQVPRVSVLLAGKVEEPLKSRLAEILPANVQYLGFQSGAALADLRRGARAILLPSLWYENQPLSILEAFALGKPVIASDIGGMAELLGQNERGLRVPMGNVDMLAQAMQWMSDHCAQARDLGAAAFRYARENHSAERHYQRLLEIYQGV